MEIQSKTWTLTVLMITALSAAGCGKKDDLFLPEQNTAVSSSQQPQADKEQKKKQPATEN